MELSVENSCFEGDSNALILPAKKNNKRKGMNRKDERIKQRKQPKLSKSQQRKLKKLEEEKEKELLLAKSIEALEKYKIPQDAFSLLQSSKNISRAETVKEKRIMAIQFSKAGLGEQHGDGAAYETEAEIEKLHSVNENDYLLQSVVSGTETAVDTVPSYQELSNGIEPCLDSVSASAFSTEKALRHGSCKLMQQDSKNSSLDFYHHDFRETSESLGKSNEIIIDDLAKDSNLPDCPLQRDTGTPVVVHVTRPNEVEEKRKDLPLVMMEQEIMEAINYHSTVIICGETGCGKTTQVPQFLYEAGFGSNQCLARSGAIGVTQPRRVAVLATARRVAYELGFHLGKEVGFQVRHEKSIGDSSAIKFMTDGILLRELQSSILVSRYSIIILDEAHERSANTDILVGLLSHSVRLRQKIYEEQQKMILSGQSITPENRIFPLKLVLMSATLRVEDFSSARNLFPYPPPVIEVPTRQFPVTLHFSKRTETVDYIGQAFKKVMSIHKKLPQGGILVFVTGQREVEYLCQKLRKASKQLTARTADGNTGNEVSMTPEMDLIEGINMREIDEAFEIHGNSNEQVIDRFSSFDEDVPSFDGHDSDVSYDSETESELEFFCDAVDFGDQSIHKDGGNVLDVLGEEGSLSSLKAAFEALVGKTTSEINTEGKQTPTPDVHSEQPNHDERKNKEGDSIGALCVLPLYAMLPAAAQLRVFEDVKEGERLVVVATNVAETSLTIPGIKYVVDTGREKVKNYNISNGMETYEIQWISKASAAQRAGRAGRTGPGHCYRLYSSAVFTNKLPDFSCPEISKMPVESIVLLLKSMGIFKVKAFPFPTPPEATALERAISCLKTLEALDKSERVTALGKAMSYYPMSPRHSRMLLTVIQILKVNNLTRPYLILGYAAAAAAALSLSNPFLAQFEGVHDCNNFLKQDSISGSLDNEITLEKQEKLRKKKLKEKFKDTRERFSNLTSDALTIAYALQCFELSNSPVEFCSENALHYKTMEEMSKLRKQILLLVFTKNLSHGVEQNFSWTRGTIWDVEQAWRASSRKLKLDEEELLGQAICAGWVDKVAKQVRGDSRASAGERKASSVRYQVSKVKEAVFIHRRSSLFRSPPEYLVYNELLYTKRPYMHGATRVKPEWLVKYAKSSWDCRAVEDPKPYYEPNTDQVYHWVTPISKNSVWELPLQSMLIECKEERVKVFAYALLEGQVLPCLRSCRERMAARPSIILSREAFSESRVGKLLFKLKNKSIDSCEKLRQVWRQNPEELHSEVLHWFKKTCHSDFEELWSRMHIEVQLKPQRRFSEKMDD